MPDADALMRLFELTGSEHDPRLGSIHRASLWDHENRRAEQLGTPEMWQEIEDAALDRAWRDLMSGDYEKRLAALPRRPPSFLERRQSVGAAERAIQSPLVAVVPAGKRGRPRSAAWRVDADRLIAMHNAAVPIAEQAEALSVSVAVVWRRRRSLGLSYRTWAQAESEAVRRMWVDAWGLLEDAAPTIRELERRSDYEDWEARALADRIDAFLRGATQTPPITEAERPSCGNCGATMLHDNPTTCPLCGHPIGEPLPPARPRLQALPGGKGAASE